MSNYCKCKMHINSELKDYVHCEYWIFMNLFLVPRNNLIYGNCKVD